LTVGRRGRVVERGGQLDEEFKELAQIQVGAQGRRE